MKRRITTTLIPLGLLLGAALWWQGPHLRKAWAAGNIWASKTAMPTARYSLAAAEINGKLYVVGGTTSTDESKKLEVYDPVTNTWDTTRADMPTARDHLAAAQINGKLYVVGGNSGSNFDIKTLEVYDPVTNTWTTKADMTYGRADLGAVAINGKLYAVGGHDNGERLEVYDPATNTWTTKHDMPRNYGSAAAAINGKLYLAGGEVNDSSLLVYDPVADTWDTTKAPLPSGHRYGAGAAINGKFYVVGGSVYGGNRSEVKTLEVYDPVTDTWTTKAEMLTGRERLAAATINGKLYAVGGRELNSGDAFNVLEEYAPPEPNAWTSKTAMPTARYAAAADEIDGKLYVAGGSVLGGASLKSLEVYDPLTNTWAAKADLSAERTGLAGATIDGKLYTVGGVGGINKLEVYDPATNTWAAKTNMPTGRAYLAAAAIHGKFYAVGGYTGTSIAQQTLEVYDPATNTWATKTNMPTGRQLLAAAAINGKLYVIGGQKNTGEAVNTLEVYDPATNLWDTTRANMPTARYGLAATTLNGKLYVLGGFNSSISYQNTVEIYNPATNTWTTAPAMPTKRSQLGAVVIAGKLFAVGGFNNISDTLNTLEAFQVTSDLTLSKSHTGNFTVGSNGSYALTVNNAANANCTEGVITVTDTLPTGLSYASVSGTGWSCAASGQTVTCKNNSLTLDAGASTNFTLNVQATASGSVTNHASVATTDEIVTDNNSANNSLGDPTTINCPSITATLSGATTICPGGSTMLSVEVTGGTGPYTVKLSDGQEKTSSTLPITFTVSPTVTTIYTVQTFADNYACGLSSSSNSVTVTVTPPDTRITSAPPATSDGNASFSFMRSDTCGNVVTFECQLDGGGFAPCTSPKSYTNLTGGAHLFEVRAKDSYGNVDSTPAQYPWTVFTSSCGTVVNPATMPAATRGTPFVQTLSAAPTGSYVFSLLSGTLPPGVSLVNTLGIYSLRGTPTAAGSYSFTIKAKKNNATCEGARTYTIVVP